MTCVIKAWSLVKEQNTESQKHLDAFYPPLPATQLQVVLSDSPRVSTQKLYNEDRDCHCLRESSIGKQKTKEKCILVVHN